MNRNKIKRNNREKRHRRVTSKVSGTESVPRLNVFRSSNHIYAQLVDDMTGKTLVSTHDLKLKAVEVKELRGKLKNAYAVGKNIADLAKEKGISTVIFDRGGYKYHGRVAALAKGARENGLSF